MTSRHVLITSVFCVLSFLMMRERVWAQQTLEGTLTIEPIFQNITIEASQASVPFTISVHNQTDLPQTIDVFALDFQQTDDQGNITFVDKASHNYQLASYISIPEKEITVKAHQTASISAQINNTASLSPGGHYAAMIVRHQQPKIEKQQQILMGLSSLVFVHKKGGERYNLSLSEYSLQDSVLILQLPQSMNMLFSNEGNIQLIPTGKVEITDMFGRVVFEGLVNDGSRVILPESKKTFMSTLEPRLKLLPVSVLTLSISGDNSLSTTPFHQQNHLIYISTWVVVITILSPVIIFTVYVLSKRRRTNLT